MSSTEVEVRIPQKVREERFIRTGQLIDEYRHMEPPASELSEQARAVLMHIYQDPEAVVCANAYPQTVKDWEKMLQEVVKASDEQLRQITNGDVEYWTHKFVVSFASPEKYIANLEAKLATRFGSHLFKLSPSYNAFLAKAARRWEEAQEQHRRDREARAIEIQRRKGWIREHGSEQLKIAFERGYDCLSRYLQERAAIEFPAYSVDYGKNAGWADRAMPSPAALQEELRIESDPNAAGCKVRTVWLTRDCDGNPVSNGGREAVVIEGYHGRNLVKTLEEVAPCPIPEPKGAFSVGA